MLSSPDRDAKRVRFEACGLHLRAHVLYLLKSKSVAEKRHEGRMSNAGREAV
jgi:hypothetical protein